MFEVRRYRVKLTGKEFVGLVHSCGAVIDFEHKGWVCQLGSTVEPIPDPVPEFAAAREKLGLLQKLLLDGKIPGCLVAVCRMGWRSEVIDGIQCWVPTPPKSSLEKAIEWTEPMTEKHVPVYMPPDLLKLLVDAARKQLAAEKGGGA